MNKEINKITEIAKQTTRILRERGREIFLRGSMATLLSATSANAVFPKFSDVLNSRNSAHVLQVENPWSNGQEILTEEGLNKKAIQLKPFQVLTISGQKIRVAGMDINVNPEQNPGQRATVAVMVKDDLTVNVEFGSGTFSGLFQLSPDTSTLQDDANAVLAAQSSRNDLAGNCLPQGCTEGTREVSFIAYDKNGKVVYEPGTDKMRAFTGIQLQLPDNVSYVGEAQYVEQSSLTAQPVDQESFNGEKIHLAANQVLTISAQKINVGGVNVDVNPERNPGQRATVAIVAKDDLVVKVQHGEGAWKGLFQLPSDGSVLLDNASTVLAAQSSRNDLAGNCLPQGCTEGTKEVLLVARTDKNGNVVYELGTDKMRAFTGTQLQLPNDITFLGQVNK